jgi:hypothetical protein
MEKNNSYPDIYLGIVCELYRDIAQCYGVSRRTQRVELRVISDRYAAEGISFLTKGLRTFGKAVDTALAKGTRLSICGFKHESAGGAIPRFLGWLLRRVFSTDGFEISNPDPYALKHLRELCFLLSKLEIPYDKEDCKTVLESFVNIDSTLPTEQAVPTANRTRDTYSFATCRWWTDEWLDKARALCTSVCSTLDPREIQPSHGPGAVATGEETVEKTKLRRIYTSLDAMYPFTEYMMFNLNHVAQDIPAENPRVIRLDQATAKVVLVPKDSRGPRLISCEPLEVQWIQQGLKKILVDRLQSCKLTAGFVNFDDQSINRNLALESSVNNEWVTLDMKDASDRVSLGLVKDLFRDCPVWLDALLASRSQSTKLPCGTEVKLNKYAPMGSALCFPVESLIFWALSVSALIQHGVKRRKALKSVYVFGDDLVVRKQDYTALLHALPLVELKFNEDKCCTARSFRESCGCDAYEGVDVTPVKLKTVWSSSNKNPKCLESYVAFSNAMYGRGHFHVAEYVRQRVINVYGKIPYTNLYEVTDSGSFVSVARGVAFVCHESSARLNRQLGFRYRFSRPNKDGTNYNRAEVQTWTSVPLKRRTKYDGYDELLRRFSSGYGSHGGVYALVRRNRLNRTWCEV